MKPKALMLSAAVLLGSAAVAFAQTSTPSPQAPAGGTQQQMNRQPASAGMSQTQTQPPRTSKHRALASRRVRSGASRRHDPATAALNLLEANGYRDFSTFHRVGHEFAITTNQNGKTVTVLADPQTKTIRTGG
jgi:hypothetical protein